MKKRVLIIGIDGGTWEILRPAMDRGYMPCLKQWVDHGCSGTLESTIPAITSAAWSSFQTGVNPGKTGVYDFANWDRESRKVLYISAELLRNTLWEVAGKAGNRIATVNVPITYPPRPINGYMITGIMTPSLDNNFTHPPELKDQLLQAVPGYHIFNLVKIKRFRARHRARAFVKQMNEIIDNRTAAAQLLIDKEPLDLMMVHFQATDVLQHVMWGYMEEGHPLYNPKLRDFILAEFYGRLDDKLRQLRSRFEEKSGGDCLTMIVSDHGFQAHHKRINFGNWLVEQGFLHIVPEKRSFGLVRDILRRTDVFGMRYLLAKSKFGRKINREVNVPSYSFDFDKSTVFSFSRGSDGFVFLLEKDRDKRSRTEAELRRRLLSLTDPAAGTKIVSRIYAAEEIYHGHRLDRMPDLIVAPSPGYSFTGNYTPEAHGLFTPIRRDKDFHVGMHHSEGVFVAVGPGVKEDTPITGARLIDIAPTVLAYMNVPVPEGMDGTVMKNIFSTAPEVVYQRLESGEEGEGGEDGSPGSPAEHNYSKQDLKNIAQRLRELGYIE